MADGNLTIPGKNHLLDLVTEVWAGLHSDDPGVNGAHELAGGNPAYARKRLDILTAEDGKRLQDNEPIFDVPAGAAVAWVGHWTAAAGGVFLGARLASGEICEQQGLFILNKFDADGAPVAVLALYDRTEG